ncbi:hypothetical protein C8F01DRAFT_1369579 [Mycena amicta]|nr:hypothetical protein C8F01DRAFT_1369579 [Mycena amicta]
MINCASSSAEARNELNALKDSSIFIKDSSRKLPAHNLLVCVCLRVSFDLVTTHRGAMRPKKAERIHSGCLSLIKLSNPTVDGFSARLAYHPPVIPPAGSVVKMQLRSSLFSPSTYYSFLPAIVPQAPPLRYSEVVTITL